MARPHRHVLVNSDTFFENLNFAYDDTKHVTRILHKVSTKDNTFNGLSVRPKEVLYNTDSIKHCIVDVDGDKYAVILEAVFDKNSILYRDWFSMCADIACVYDLSSGRVFYQPMSAYCKMLQCHAMSYLNLNNYVCLSQFWVRSPYDNVKDCSMSFCTSYKDLNGKFCNFDLGYKTTQDEINASVTSSRKLNLCFRILPYDENDYNIVEYTKPDCTAENIYTHITISNSIYTVKCKVEAFTEDNPDEVCKDAFGFVELDHTKCFVSESKVLIDNGVGVFTIQPMDTDFAVVVSAQLKDKIFAIFESK